MQKIEIYTKSWCPYCARAKELLKSKGVRFEETDIGHNEERNREMQQRSGRSTVPQIFIDGHRVGGCDDLMEADRAGQLDQLLRKEHQAIRFSVVLVLAWIGAMKFTAYEAASISMLGRAMSR